MLVVSLKTSRKKIIAAVAAIVCAAALIAYFVTIDKAPQGGEASKESRFTVGSTARNSEDIRCFLSELGWETAGTPAEELDVLIPEQFDDVMLRYNAIQLEQGGDLSKYRGKTVHRYTFVVTNHPRATADKVRANVLVYNNKIIGGDICSLASDGFMHGFLSD
ncbi:MAG: DUF4830 domain-containing protein [Oscillospiraceae bacterium]|nr:DUF4830 domain-containing protein [Oscillospiraceae bacterium]